VEAFLVVVLAGAFLAVGAWALFAIRRVLPTPRPDPTQRRPGDD
jgi:hypothetical protein